MRDEQIKVRRCALSFYRGMRITGIGEDVRGSRRAVPEGSGKSQQHRREVPGEVKAAARTAISSDLLPVEAGRTLSDKAAIRRLGDLGLKVKE